MRKVTTFLIPFLLFSLVSISISQPPPPPFEKIKELVLRQGSLNASGSYSLIFELREASTYVLAYFPQFAMIGIGKTIDGRFYAAEYWENERKFTLYIRPYRYEFDEKTVTTFAYKIFRELVEKNLI